jgi:cell division protein YceG involved in septum cleavage
MFKGILKLIVVLFAVVGGVNIYTSNSFQEFKTSLLKNNNHTIVAIGDVVKDITHTDSVKNK